MELNAYRSVLPAALALDLLAATFSASCHNNQEYSEALPAEQSTVGEPSSELHTWPSKGKIVFKNFSLRYRDGPRVLKKVSFEVESTHKVGIVGRTGAGK